ncbi:MAG: hypothetical protein Q8O99_03120 [bacterium]|nr:hypothetical protein [bacterium]
MHEYILIAGDVAGNQVSTTVSYNVLADDVTNINIEGFTVSDLDST